MNDIERYNFWNLEITLGSNCVRCDTRISSELVNNERLEKPNSESLLCNDCVTITHIL